MQFLALRPELPEGRKSVKIKKNTRLANGSGSEWKFGGFESMKEMGIPAIPCAQRWLLAGGVLSSGGIVDVLI